MVSGWNMCDTSSERKIHDNDDVYLLYKRCLREVGAEKSTMRKFGVVLGRFLRPTAATTVGLHDQTDIGGSSYLKPSTTLWENA